MPPARTGKLRESRYLVEPMKKLLALLVLSSLVACKHNDGPTNPYIHKKHKPSEEVSGDYKKMNKYMRKHKKNIFFEKKKGPLGS